MFRKLSLLLALATVCQAIELCTLSLFSERDYWDWRYAGTGFMSGLFDLPPDDKSSCEKCVEFGKQLGAVQSSVYTLEYKRGDWIRLGAINNLSTTDKIFKILELYEPMQKFAENFLLITENQDLRGMLANTVDLMRYRENQGPMFTRFISKAFISYNMYESIPGSSCYLVGYKASVPLRLVMGYAIDAFYS